MKKLALMISLLSFTAFTPFAMAADKAVQQKAEQQDFPVTTAFPQVQPLIVSEQAIGTIQSLTTPMVAAQVGGEVVSVNAEVGSPVTEGTILAVINDTDYQLAKQSSEADIQRIKALIPAQALQVKRFTNLVAKHSSSQSKLDEAQAQLGALRAELVGAKVRLAEANRKITLCKILSPIKGVVDTRKISKGDYLKAGTPAFHLVNNQNLQAILPFPERLRTKIMPGQTTQLISTMSPKQMVEAKISELRPMIVSGSHSLEAIVNFTNQWHWFAGGSVTAQVTLAKDAHALWIPEQSVVQRPAGKIVYVIEKGLAKQKRVETGQRQDGKIQIRSGITAHDQIVVAGAGFLTEGTKVKVTLEPPIPQQKANGV